MRVVKGFLRVVRGLIIAALGLVLVIVTAAIFLPELAATPELAALTRMCDSMGQFMAAVTETRNAGVSRESMPSSWPNHPTHFQLSETLSPALQFYASEMLTRIHIDTPHRLTPAQIQKETATGCLQQMRIAMGK